MIYSLGVLTGIFLVGRGLKNRIHQGIWLSKPQSQKKAITFSKIYPVQVFGKIVLVLLIVSVPFLGTNLVFGLSGFGVGAATIILARTLIDFIFLLPGSIKPKQAKEIFKISDRYCLGASVLVRTADIEKGKGRIIATPTIDENGEQRLEAMPKRYTLKLENGITVYCREENIAYDYFTPEGS